MKRKWVAIVTGLTISCFLTLNTTVAQAPPAETSQPSQTEKPAVEKKADKKPAKKATRKAKKKPAPDEKVVALQKALNAEGYKLKADGFMGKKTRTALKRYQKKNNLKVTGQPDQATLDRLGIK